MVALAHDAGDRIFVLSLTIWMSKYDFFLQQGMCLLKWFAVSFSSQEFSLMDRILRVPLCPNSQTFYKIAASLCLSPDSKSLMVPSANVIFFNGDRVEGTGNPVVERLSDVERVAKVLVSKFGDSVNTWVIGASTYHGPFAVYKDFIPSVNGWGDPKSYSPMGFPASTTTVSLLSSFLGEAKNVIPGLHEETARSGTSVLCQPKAYILGFSKGGTVINQLLTELGNLTYVSVPFMDGSFHENHEDARVIPNSKETLLNSIAEIHYVDVGLNSAGAYLTNHDVVEGISARLKQGASRLRVILHGTPRQWCDNRRVWIRNEKNILIQMLQSEAERSDGRLEVCERFYFADSSPNMQMHFEIIEQMDVS
ncbi:LOW QUALITY PROTEIN: Mitochondrial protein C2orf69 [Dillenia turbinata]|uniref:Mitochondrial protein C2orf69 n=1 Tax=Dillenia turbinata TaxID=194707 RepID=A0AAN8UT36_9MAGN